MIPAVGGAPLRLGAVVAHDGAWSPDGKRIVFARREVLYVAGSDGSEPRKLATTPGRAFWLRWSPDGARLRFTVVSPQGNTRSLWEVSAEGHGLRPVPLGRSEHDVDCCGEWSPDGRHFFFRRFRDNRPDIWAIRERTGLFGGTTTEPARVTSGPLLYPAGVPTRDGRRLLVIAGQPRGENLRFDLGTREFAPYDAGRVGRVVRLLARRKVDGLRPVPGEHPVAQQSRWQRAAPAHATAAAAPAAAVVAGWHADRFHGTDTRTALENLRHCGGGGRSAADPGRGPSRVGSRLGSRRAVPDVRPSSGLTWPNRPCPRPFISST